MRDLKNPPKTTTRDNDDSLDIEVRWSNRRKMAWLSLLFLMFITFSVVFFLPTNRITVLEPILGWFFITMSSIVGAYMGFATAMDYSRVKNPSAGGGLSYGGSQQQMGCDSDDDSDCEDSEFRKRARERLERIRRNRGIDNPDA